MCRKCMRQEKPLKMQGNQVYGNNIKVLNKIASPN